MKERILVVDDEKDSVSFIQDYFEMEGFEVLTVVDGI